MLLSALLLLDVCCHDAAYLRGLLLRLPLLHDLPARCH